MTKSKSYVTLLGATALTLTGAASVLLPIWNSTFRWE